MEPVDSKRPKDNWEYVKEFCDRFGRIPKDMDELEALVSYVISERQKWATYLEKLKGQNDVPSRETIFGIWELGNFWKENPEEREGLTQLQYIQKYWLEKCDYMKEQKPAEWGEEDETAFGDLMWCIEQAKKSAKDENDMGNVWFAENWVKNRLKFLRPQPHWKPSEQEKGALRTAIHVLTEERNFPKAAAQLQNILDAFEGKESRKDWKPREEDLIALEYCVEHCCPELLSLYNDLRTEL